MDLSSRLKFIQVRDYDAIIQYENYKEVAAMRNRQERIQIGLRAISMAVQHRTTFTLLVKFHLNCLSQILWALFISAFINSLLLSGYICDPSMMVLRADEELYFEIVYPEEISYTFKITSANNFGTRFNKTMKSVPLVPVQPLQLCNPATNAFELQGNVALAKRGECSFLTKAVNAEKAGAKAIIVMDSEIDNDEVILMEDDETGRDAFIPAVFLLGKDGYMILKTLAELNIDSAIINIPINMTGVPLHKRNLPSWNLW